VPGDERVGDGREPAQAGCSLGDQVDLRVAADLADGRPAVRVGVEVGDPGIAAGSPSPLFGSTRIFRFSNRPASRQRKRSLPTCCPQTRAWLPRRWLLPGCSLAVRPV